MLRFSTWDALGQESSNQQTKRRCDDRRRIVETRNSIWDTSSCYRLRKSFKNDVHSAKEKWELRRAFIHTQDPVRASLVSQSRLSQSKKLNSKKESFFVVFGHQKKKMGTKKEESMIGSLGLGGEFVIEDSWPNTATLPVPPNTIIAIIVQRFNLSIFERGWVCLSHRAFAL